MSTYKNKPVFWLFVAPCLFAFVMVMIIPFILGVYYSFTDWNAVSMNINWVGISNYREVFSNPRFLHSFYITTMYALLNIVAVNVVAFALALLVTGKLKGANFYRSGFFIPNLIGGLVLGFLWQFILNTVLPSTGSVMGIEWLRNLMPLAKPNQALGSIVVVSTWQYAGYIMMIYIAGIQNVSDSLLEAAQIDGATYFQRLRHILFPMIAPAFTIASFLTLVNSFKQFDVNVSLTNGGPPKTFMDMTVNSTDLLALNIYKEAFTYNRLYSAQARSVIFFIVLTGVSLIQVYFNKKREVEL
ncbi:MAG: sugar ABC transporter permease [Clostridiales bacterium]|jgi:raffinose/stachyose/melibiose transport system permease protein|nr:sugar ABC transporter permease [Clostridiales bacterium]